MKEKDMKLIKSLKYRQHKQERANYECYKLIKANDELFMKWKRKFIQKYEVCRDEVELYSHDIKRAYVEIFIASAKTLAFTQENAHFLSNEYRRCLTNQIKDLTEWLDTLMNAIEHLKKEE